MALLVIASSLVSCTYGTYDDAVARFNNNAPPAPPPPPPPPMGLGPNFSEIQAIVFTPSCATSGCHFGANPQAGLNLEAANSYMQLVGMASSQDPGIQRVNQGNPNISYLIQKLEGTAGGGQMPPSGPLPQPDIDVIRQWITDGALDDRIAASSPIRVNSLSPMPGATLTSTPAQIIAGFDRQPNASTVNATTFILEASGGDGSFAEMNEIQIMAGAMGVSVPGANPQSAVFDLTGVVLADETYRIRLLGSAASIILDLDGNALDGEYLGVLPSGDGTEGGDFEVQFTITALTMDQIQATVFAPSCAGCHSGGNPDGDLDLSDANTSHTAMFNMPSQQQVGATLVIPMNPDNSYLIQKLEGAVGIAGVRMPPGVALPQTTINDIRQWISNGAVR